MTDAERARKFCRKIRETGQTADDAAVFLEAEFAAVRAEERNACIAWVRAGARDCGCSARIEEWIRKQTL